MTLFIQIIARLFYTILVLFFISLPIGFVYFFKTLIYSGGAWSQFLFIVGLVAVLVFGFMLVFAIAVGLNKLEEK